MNDADRRRIFEALLGDAVLLPENDIARLQLEDCARGTLEVLDPVLDEIIDRLAEEIVEQGKLIR